ncbi:hypothetical protein SUDANB19_06250 [Streptomyces sp. enrichment culture]
MRQTLAAQGIYVGHDVHAEGAFYRHYMSVRPIVTLRPEVIALPARWSGRISCSIHGT